MAFPGQDGYIQYCIVLRLVSDKDLVQYSKNELKGPPNIKDISGF